MEKREFVFAGEMTCHGLWREARFTHWIRTAAGVLHLVDITCSTMCHVRAYHIHPSQPDERRWSILHMLALQTLNATHWASQIEGVDKTIEQVGESFMQNLTKHLLITIYTEKFKEKEVKDKLTRKMEEFDPPPTPIEAFKRDWHCPPMINIDDDGKIRIAPELGDMTHAPTTWNHTTNSNSTTNKRRRHHAANR